MALGVPVVSTAMMGTRDVLRPGLGALIAEEDEEEFAAKVSSRLRDPLQRERLARAGAYLCGAVLVGTGLRQADSGVVSGGGAGRVR